IISPTLVSQLRLLFPSLLSRQGWERQSSQRAYGWALQNPKVAILFLACDDLASWRRAVIFGLEDGMLPFKESDLDGVAADPKRVVSQQWRVLVKQLPLNGSITELENKDALALRSISLIKERPGQTIDKVKWLGSQNSRIYVRKVIQYPDEVGKLSALDQIRSFRRLKHANLLSLTCAYGQGMSVAAITPVADCDLEAFLNTPSNTKRPERLLGWINDLTQALEHLHASDLLHRHIRPTKVLVDSSHRVLFSFLGLAGTPQLSPTFSPHQYTYAAPEVILRNKYSPSSDVFSLGCLFLDILTAATQPTLETPITDFASFRAASA
ncbi:kinase-like protein, partial [Viridothelium virens]